MAVKPSLTKMIDLRRSLNEPSRTDRPRSAPITTSFRMRSTVSVG